VQRADVALITNISEDHLGDFGSQNLQELFDLKWIVMQSLDENSIAVLNADDPMLVERSDELLKPQVCWFTTNVKNPKVYEQISKGARVTTIEDGNIIRYDGKHWHTLCPVASVPITLNGIAKHNVANALAAVSLCNALGVNDDAIVSGLVSMTSNENPGRCNLFRVNGCEVLLDFAHNPDAMNVIFEIARHHPAKRRVLCFGQAGDRTDGLIKQLARGAWTIGLDRIIISELGAYTRGREAGEVYALLREELLRVGASENQISYHQKESESLDEALAWAQPGDLVIMLALGESNELIHKLTEIGESV
jgi:UDP-N-acetylmuramyl tripeptide synthase